MLNKLNFSPLIQFKPELCWFIWTNMFIYWCKYILMTYTLSKLHNSDPHGLWMPRMMPDPVFSGNESWGTWKIMQITHVCISAPTCKPTISDGRIHSTKNSFHSKRKRTWWSSALTQKQLQKSVAHYELCNTNT